MATPSRASAGVNTAIPPVGPVGGGIAAIPPVTSGQPSVVQMQSDHGLADQDRVRVGPPGTNGTPAQLYYVKCGGYKTNEFAVYSNPDLKVPAVLNASVGTEVVQLAVKDWAVVAGVNIYPKYSPLRGALGDAERFSHWLKTSAYLPDDQVFEVPASLTPPTQADDVRPTFEDGKRPFQLLSEMAGARDLHYLGRRLYIFMSGHGILPAGGDKVDFGEAALLMPKTNIFDHIAGRAHAERFRGPGVFDEVVLLMDCCRDWKDRVSMTPPLIPVFQVDQRQPGRKFYMLATQLDSVSRERDDICPPEFRGVFTHMLLEALASPGLCDADGVLTGKILADRVKKDVFDKTNSQIPDPEYDPDFVFLRRPAPPPKPQVRVTFGSAVYGETFELRGGTNYPNPDSVRVADQQPWTAALTGQGHIWQIKSTSSGVSKNIELDPRKQVVDVNIP